MLQGRSCGGFVEPFYGLVFQWGGKQQKAFDTLKERISIVPVLTLPDLQQPFEIETDASEFTNSVLEFPCFGKIGNTKR